MAGSSGRSEWERQQAAFRRELERQAREQARIVKEREKVARQRHLESQEKAAHDMSAKVDGQIGALDEMLTGVLSRRPLAFDQLRVTAKVPKFDPGPLGDPGAAPDWTDFAPAQPGALNRLFGGNARRERQTAEAQQQFESAMSSYRDQEAERQRALAAARAEHERRAAAAQVDAAARNAELDAWRAAFSAGEAESVESFVCRVLDASSYPVGFPSSVPGRLPAREPGCRR